MYILGISGQYRDASVALIKDGRIIAALEEEKIARASHIGIHQSGGLPYRAIEFCLRSADIDISAVDYVAYYCKPWKSAGHRLNFDARRAYASPVDAISHGIAGINELRDRLRTRELIRQSVADRSRVVSTDHQIAHAASSFYLSGFDRAAILVLGGVGDFVAIAAGIGEGTRIRILDRIEFPTSLGWIYSLMTGYLGFRSYCEEHKTQWLSVAGEPEFIGPFRDLIKIDSRGVPVINTSYFAPLRRGDPFSGLFYKRFGDQLRRSNGHAKDYTRDTDHAELDASFNGHGGNGGHRGSESALLSYRRNLACSLQQRLEEVVLAMGENLCRRLGTDSLCLAGGVALNNLLVSRLVRQSGCKHLFVQPAAGNTGASLGAALHLWHDKLSGSPGEPLAHVFLGPSYSDQEVKHVLDNCKLTYRYLTTEQRLIDEVVELLRQERIVGWFQGRAEFGPRSLGARSILATPLQPYMKENLNHFVKHREDFRPFGVSVPEDQEHEFFEASGPLSEFLLTVSRVREEKRSLIPAAWFGDGLVRVHRVSRRTNPLFWRLLKRFGEESGVPVLLNTSFNLFGDPIVCTPRDALRSFYCSGIDALAINNFLVVKSQ